MNALLAQAKVKPEAKKIVLIASDGFTAPVALSAVTKRADGLVAFGDGSQLHAAMPGMASHSAASSRNPILWTQIHADERR